MESSSDTQAAYSEIYSNEGLLQRDSFYSWIISLLNPKAGNTLADISCGKGRLVASVEELGLQALGIDFAIEALRDGQKQSSHARWIVGDGEKLPLKDKSVDYITHIGSLEHYIHASLWGSGDYADCKGGWHSMYFIAQCFRFLWKYQVCLLYRRCLR